MLINLYPIKNANGLLWYSFDYLRQAPPGITIICRKEQVSLIKSQAPRANVIACNLWIALKTIAINWLNCEKLIAFTPHPVPFYKKQIVIVHDDFPFTGRGSRAKIFLFWLAAATSRCKIGYINKSNAERFIDSVGLQKNQKFYIPNRSPQTLKNNNNRVSQPGPYKTIGLFGSDSPKKQYDLLFASAQRLNKLESYSFKIYGTENAYTKSLKAAFPAARVEVIESSNMPMQEFLEQIDLAVSCSAGEGFGRPLAMALSLGTPTFLVESETFREFFDNSAIFYPVIDDLWNALEKPLPNIGNEAWQITLKNINDAANVGASILWCAA